MKRHRPAILLLALSLPLFTYSSDALASDADDGMRESAGTRSAGGRWSFTRLQGSDADDTGHGFGLTFSSYSERYAKYKSLSLRQSSFGFLGGGMGLEGGLGWDQAVGYRFPVAENHGPVLRLGMRGSLLGNQKFYESLLELPQVQLGYQTLRPNHLFEVGGRAGYLLAGRFKPGDDTIRKLGKSFDVGGYGALHWDVIHLDVQYSRVFLDESLDDVDLVFGRLCGDARPVQLCADIRVDRGGVVMPENSKPDGTVTSYYGGWSIALIQPFWRKERRERKPSRQRSVLPEPATW